jgi:bifunctional DNA-binding transcriptional regulator/antitoxin component of YhaV-PrlF toxin-antitoxin module
MLARLTIIPDIYRRALRIEIPDSLIKYVSGKCSEQYAFLHVV